MGVVWAGNGRSLGVAWAGLGTRCRAFGSQREESQKKEDACADFVESRETVFYEWFVGREGAKVGSLKRRVQGHVAWWEMKNAHAAVARNAFFKSNAQNTLYGPLAEVRMLKSARRCGVKNVSKSKC